MSTPETPQFLLQGVAPADLGSRLGSPPGPAQRLAGRQSAKVDRRPQSPARWAGLETAGSRSPGRAAALEERILALAQQVEIARARCLALARSRGQLRREAPSLNPCATAERRGRLAERAERAERSYGRLCVELAETLRDALAGREPMPPRVR